MFEGYVMSSLKYWMDIFWYLDSLLRNKLFSWPLHFDFLLLPNKSTTKLKQPAESSGRLVLLSLWAYNCQQLELCHVMSAPKSMEPQQNSTSCYRRLQSRPTWRRGKGKTTVNPWVGLGHQQACLWIRKVLTKARCFDRWGWGGPGRPRSCPEPHFAFSGNSFGFIHSQPTAQGPRSFLPFHLFQGNLSLWLHLICAYLPSASSPIFQ